MLEALGKARVSDAPNPKVSVQCESKVVLNRLEQAPEQVAVAETAVPVL